MRINTTLKVLAGAVALACAGGAFAQTTTTTGAGGTIFLTLNDETNGNSYLFDTGLSASSFADPTSVGPINLAADPNYQAFLTAEGGTDTITYSVLAGYSAGSTTKTTLFTSSGTVSSVAGKFLNSAYAQITGYLSAADGVASTTPGSEFSNSLPATEWFSSGNEGSFIGALSISGDNAAPGSAIAFYSETSSALTSATKQATVGTFLGTWTLSSAGVLSYSEPTSAVPLPAPLVLLLSGLGLMGVVARRKSGSDAGMNASAA